MAHWEDAYWHSDVAGEIGRAPSPELVTPPDSELGTVVCSI